MGIETDKSKIKKLSGDNCTILFGFNNRKLMEKFLLGDGKPDMIKFVKNADDIKQLAINFNCEFWINFKLSEYAIYEVNMYSEDT